VEVEIQEMLLSIPLNRTPDQPSFFVIVHLGTKAPFSCFRKSCFRKQVEHVFIFCVSSCFCFLSFCF
jgi:hypothetical protein